ncbi:4'-phosphopantetheinyl transferase family protein [Spirosoma areae]
MIGNDIVDLAQAKQDSNWRRPGFLDKLFTVHEQQLIRSNTTNPDRMVWLLWSMKESAYKMAIRQGGKRIFAPLKLACQLNASPDGEVMGTVVCTNVYQTKSVITDAYIASLAYSSGVSPAFCQQIVLFDNVTYVHQHQAMLMHIKQHCAARFSLPEQAITIQKNVAGVPSLCIQPVSGQRVSLPLSLSHHGHYGAYVIGRSDWHE